MLTLEPELAMISLLLTLCLKAYVCTQKKLLATSLGLI